MLYDVKSKIAHKQMNIKHSKEQNQSRKEKGKENYQAKPGKINRRNLIRNTSQSSIEKFQNFVEKILETQ